MQIRLPPVADVLFVMKEEDITELEPVFFLENLKTSILSFQKKNALNQEVGKKTFDQ